MAIPYLLWFPNGTQKTFKLGWLPSGILPCLLELNKAIWFH
jgi:hypothetical protein